jgi:hypothetical protein
LQTPEAVAVSCIYQPPPTSVRAAACACLTAGDNWCGSQEYCREHADKPEANASAAACVVADERWPMVLWLAEERRWDLLPCGPLPPGVDEAGFSSLTKADPAANRGEELDASCFYHGRCARRSRTAAACECVAGYQGARCDEWRTSGGGVLPIQQWLLGHVLISRLPPPPDARPRDRSELRVFDTATGKLTLADGHPMPVRFLSCHGSLDTLHRIAIATVGIH